MSKTAIFAAISMFLIYLLSLYAIGTDNKQLGMVAVTLACLLGLWFLTKGYKNS